MKKLSRLVTKFGGGIAVTVLIVGIFTVLYALSWIATCGLIYLITLCFGWAFKWSIATGIWLLMIILRSIFSHSVTVEK